MLSDIIKPGQRIDIQAMERAILGGSGEKAKIYSSKVYDVLDEQDVIEILMPMDGTKLILLPVNGEYQFCFYTDKGLYQCFVRIIDRYKNNNMYMLACEATSKPEKFQRREYYRYRCIMPLKTRVLLEEEKEMIDGNRITLVNGLPFAKSKILDIGGGGLRFSAPEKYEVGQEVVTSFPIVIHGKEENFDLVGKVLSCAENAEKTGMWDYRLQFTVIHPKQREMIIRFIFEEERQKMSRR